MILAISFLILTLGVFIQGMVFGMAKERMEWLALNKDEQRARARDLYPPRGKE